MPDYGFLLGAQIPQAPNPLALAGQGLTLGHLALGNQMEQLQLQTAQQMAQALPEFYARLSGQGGGGPPGQGGGGPVDVNSVLSDIAQKYPLAGQQLTNMVLGMQEKQATISEKGALAGKAQEETKNMELANIQRLAASLGDQATPQQASVVYSRLRAAGADPTNFDGSSPAAFVSSVTTGLQDPKVRQEMLLAPQKMAIEQANLARQQAQFYGGEAFQDPDTKAWFVRIPKLGGGWMVQPASTSGVPAQPAGVNIQQPAAPGQPAINVQNASPGEVAAMRADIASGGNVYTPAGQAAAPSPQVPINAQGAPVTGPSYQQKQQFATSQDEMKNLTARSQSAAQLKAMLTEMRTQEAQGIFSGGLMGTEGAKRMASLLGGIGLLPADVADRLSHTQVFDAQAQQVIADAVSQFAGARIAARELPFFAGTKPSTLQMAQARDQLYDSLYNRSQRIIDQATQAQAHLDSGNTSLANFQPKFAHVQLPDVQVSKPPDPATFPAGKALKDSSGVIHRVVNGQWQPPFAANP